MRCYIMAIVTERHYDDEAQHCGGEQNDITMVKHDTMVTERYYNGETRQYDGE